MILQVLDPDRLDRSHVMKVATSSYLVKGDSTAFYVTVISPEGSSEPEDTTLAGQSLVHSDLLRGSRASHDHFSPSTM